MVSCPAADHEPPRDRPGARPARSPDELETVPYLGVERVRRPPRSRTRCSFRFGPGVAGARRGTGESRLEDEGSGDELGLEGGQLVELALGHGVGKSLKAGPDRAARAASENARDGRDDGRARIGRGPRDAGGLPRGGAAARRRRGEPRRSRVAPQRGGRSYAEGESGRPAEGPYATRPRPRTRWRSLRRCWRATAS